MMSAPARWELWKAIHAHYRSAPRASKGRILDEFCRATGYHRKYALRLLNGAPPGAARPRRRRRPATYSGAMIQALRVIWEAAGYPWSVRLKALLPAWLPWARRRLGLSAAVCRQLRAISARQIDRRLAPPKRQPPAPRYCQTQAIQFTRGRPYKKDDNAHIEQKNWTHVRKLVGYHRYDTPSAVAALNDLYGHELRLFQNLFLPSVKLLRKERVGARQRRRYDAPRTPLERVQACPTAHRPVVPLLVAVRDRIDPFALAATIDHKLDRLLRLATAPRAQAPPAPPVGQSRRAGPPRHDHRALCQPSAPAPGASCSGNNLDGATITPLGN